MENIHVQGAGVISLYHAMGTKAAAYFAKQMKHNSKMSLPSDYKAAILEIAEQSDYRMNGPKDQVKCPDCGAIVNARKREDDHYELIFVEHAK